MHFAQRLHDPSLAPRNAALPWIVSSVGDPWRERGRANCTADFNRREHVIDRAPTNRRILIGDRSVLVALILEHIRIDRANAQTTRLCRRHQRARVGPTAIDRQIPQHMNGDARARTR